MDHRNDKIDFSSPMKQAPLGIIIAFVDIFQHALRQLWALIAVLVLNMGKTPVWVHVVVIAALIIGLIILGFLKYQTLTFYFKAENREFVLTKGILKKKKTALQVEKIQQVVLTQNFIQKLLNLYGMKVSTAGSSAEEIKIGALSFRVAEGLKNLLSEVSENTNRSSEPVAENAITLPVSTLFKIAVTSNYLRSFSLLFAFVVGGLNFLKDLAPLSGFSEEEVFNQLNTNLLLTYLTRIVALVLLLIFCINIVRGVLFFFNYTILFKPSGFHFQYGLFNSKSTLVQYSKVQVVKTVSNYFQRKMRFKRMFIYQKSSNFHADKNASVEIPGADAATEQQVFTAIFHQLPATVEIFYPNYRKIIPSVFLLMVLPTAAFFLYYGYRPDGIYLFLLLTWACFASLIIYFGFRNNRLYVGDEFIIVQSGVWDVAQQILQPEKIQAITIKQMWWQVAADVCHITLHTSAKSVRFNYANKSMLLPYLNKWLYDMEKNDEGAND